MISTRGGYFTGIPCGVLEAETGFSDGALGRSFVGRSRTYTGGDCSIVSPCHPGIFVGQFGLYFIVIPLNGVLLERAKLIVQAHARETLVFEPEAPPHVEDVSVLRT